MATFRKRGKKGQETWSVVFDLPGHIERKQKRLSGFKTRQEANLAHISFLANYKPPAKNSNNSHKFEAVFERYLQTLKHSVKESSYSAIESSFRNHIMPHFKGRVLNEITPDEVTKWIMLLNNKSLMFQTKKKIIGFLSTFFTYCVGDKLIKLNPCLNAIKIKNTEIKKEPLIWSEEEFVKFISVVDNIVHKVFFSFLYLTGCRRGEAMALTWEDIAGNILTINKSLGYHTINGGYSISTPKNFYSNRKIVLPSGLLGILSELKLYYKKYDGFSESNYIFGNLKPLPPETIRKRLRAYCKEAGVKVIRIHDFRHSHASVLINKGHDIVTIAKRLGHGNIEMTLNRYAHLMPNNQQELADSVDLNIKM